MLTVQGLTRSFGGLRAVDDLSFEIAAGGTTGLVGPNGAGKTTVFNLVTGFLRPDGGRVLLRGTDITGWAPHRIARAGVVRTFQGVRLFSKLTVLANALAGIPEQSGENPLFAMAAPHAVRRQYRRDTAKAREWLEFVGLAGRERALAGELSYGQQKRLSIARALATDAELLLLDEPSSGLDPVALEDMVGLIVGLPRVGRTVAIVEHNLEVIGRLCETVLFLDRGRLIAEGAPKEIFARDDLADLYFGSAAGNGSLAAAAER